MTDAPGVGRQRLDKWLWQTRFFKTRALAAKAVSSGQVRVNGQRTDKPHRAVGPGDVLTFPQGDAVRVVRIEGLPDRRGPATEARLLYADLAPPVDRAASSLPDGLA